MAGSVMPRAAVRAEGMAKVRFLGLLVLSDSDCQGPQWGMWAAEAMGIQMFREPSDSRPASMTLYIW